MQFPSESVQHTIHSALPAHTHAVLLTNSQMGMHCTSPFTSRHSPLEVGRRGGEGRRGRERREERRGERREERGEEGKGGGRGGRRGGRRVRERREKRRGWKEGEREEGGEAEEKR